MSRLGRVRVSKISVAFIYYLSISEKISFREYFLEHPVETNRTTCAIKEKATEYFMALNHRDLAGIKECSGYDFARIVTDPINWNC